MGVDVAGARSDPRYICTQKKKKARNFSPCYLHKHSGWLGFWQYLVVIRPSDRRRKVAHVPGGLRLYVVARHSSIQCVYHAHESRPQTVIFEAMMCGGVCGVCVGGVGGGGGVTSSSSSLGRSSMVHVTT